ncbi:MAG TPA: hypothetical protein VGQ93_09900 [Lysobacter sp.]|nr:hypothetical protein [Lysobacter sp.]
MFLLLLVIPANAEVLYNGEAGQALHNSEAGHPFAVAFALCFSTGQATIKSLIVDCHGFRAWEPKAAEQAPLYKAGSKGNGSQRSLG